MGSADHVVTPPDAPEGVSSPVHVNPLDEVVPFWTGLSELRQGSATRSGMANVFLDMVPRPIIRFDFQAGTEDAATSSFEQFRRAFEGNLLDNGEMACGEHVGGLTVHPSGACGGAVTGDVGGWIQEPTELFTSVKLLVINGPTARGRAIRLGRGFIAGRLQAGSDEGFTVTVDRLFFDETPSRSAFAFTHVAEIESDQPRKSTEFKEMAECLFWVLSLMKGGWVGLVGPWFYDKAVLRRALPRVTKASRNRSAPGWLPKVVLDVFDEVFCCVRAAIHDTRRWEAVQSGIHWLVESQLCAGGVEGSLILQQTALEALAWFAIVEDRKSVSHASFDGLSAMEKIRSLTSLYSIPITIPAHIQDLVDCATENPQLVDLVAMLVHVRNALVHGSPKKVARLFSRLRGESERTALWYLVGGILEQAVLAILGYNGPIARRDVEAKFAVSAIRPAPWANRAEGLNQEAE